MKKISLFYSLLFIASVSFLGSCGNKDDEAPQPSTPDECAQAEFPATTGTAIVNIKNFSNGVVNAAAGELVTFAVEVTKDANRPQKLKAYQTDCKNALGEPVTFPEGQSASEQNNTRFDLRNTSTQVRNIIYSVPSGMSTIYLNFAVEESGNTVTYKRITINVSGSGVLDVWKGLKIVAQSPTSSLPSRASTNTGQTYVACDAASNLSSIDITLLENGGKTYILSNPKRFEAPFNRPTTGLTTCNDDGTTTPIVGGPKVYFTPTSLGLSATDADLSGIAQSTDQFIEVTGAGQAIGFVKEDGRKGVIIVTAASDLGTVESTVTFDVIVQR
jgi:hypothetical protein